MAYELFPGDNWAPLSVGVRFRLGNSDQGDQWVEIYALDSKYVYARGLDNHIADLKIERWKFDDVVSDKDFHEHLTLPEMEAAPEEEPELPPEEDPEL